MQGRMVEKDFYDPIIRFLILFLLPFELLANIENATQFQHVNLNINFTQPVSSSEKQDYRSKSATRKNWDIACEKFSKAMTIGRGPWGVGIFKNVSCILDSEVTFGSPSQKDWLLKIEVVETGVEFSLFDDQDRDSDAITQFALPKNKKFLELLKSQAFVDLISLRLLNHLPVMGILEIEHLNNNVEYSRRNLDLSEFGLKLNPPLAMFGFDTTSFNKMVMPDIIGRIVCKSFCGGDAIPANNKSKMNRSSILSQESIEWRLDKKFTKANWDSGIWFQDERGSGFLEEDIDDIIMKIVTKFDQEQNLNFLNAAVTNVKEVASNMAVSLKFASQAYTESKAVKNRKMYMTEVSFSGNDYGEWIYRFEKSPKSAAEEDGANVSFESSNHSLTRRNKFEGFRKFTGFEIETTVGVASVKATLIDRVDESTGSNLVHEYNISRAYQFGINGGVYWASRRFAFKPSVGYLYGSNFDQNNLNSFTDLILGVDFKIFKDAPWVKFSDFGKTFIGVFYRSEKLALTGSSQSSETNSKIQTIQTLNSGLAGFSVGVMW